MAISIYIQILARACTLTTVHLLKHIVRIPIKSVGSPSPSPTPSAILSDVLSPPFELAGTAVGSVAIVGVDFVVDVPGEDAGMSGINALVTIYDCDKADA
jgi:hypothetical protein